MIKRYDGSNYVEPSTIKRYDGSNWVDVENGYRWDGSNWVQFYTKQAVFHLETSGLTSVSSSIDSDNVITVSGKSSALLPYVEVISDYNIASGDTVSFSAEVANVSKVLYVDIGLKDGSTSIQTECTDVSLTTSLTPISYTSTPTGARKPYLKFGSNATSTGVTVSFKFKIDALVVKETTIETKYDSSKNIIN